MFSQFKSISVIGMSNPEMFLSDKDLNSVELNFLVRPTMEFEAGECDVAPLRDGHGDDEEEEEDKCKFLVSTLKIKLPATREFEIEEDLHDGFKTPTSLDQKIPVILPCPPAPRKPKSLPSNKRKSSRRRVLLDLSNEIESLFPPALRADLGGKIKKVRQEINDNKSKGY
ncbi:cyclin-dependent protein kinase inhibitor SMR10 [Manihot esculenta]|uniref:Uncharacterized protein n=1 Tax=Manihot esculenta TaxID=3983 RepID=A0A2C9VZ39_MANES|nr:cyclin-dependent protein kinase inhibitor SMR10 [Manihot esculenta]OAY51808.1 hypothetical protein MANES_04G034400v8 [Manihot esculenta]